MAIINLQIPTLPGPGPEIPIATLSPNFTVLYAGGDPTDVTNLQVSDDGVNWVGIGVKNQSGGSWLQNITCSAEYIRVNRLVVGPKPTNEFGGAAASIGGNDANALSQIGPRAAPPFSNLGSFTGFLLTPGAVATALAAIPLPLDNAGIDTNTYQIEANLVYTDTTTHNGGSRKLLATVKLVAGTATIEHQAATNQADNAEFAANVTTVFAITGNKSITLNVTGIAATNIDWAVNGVINQVF